jgi:hypothetical protein
LVDIDGLGAHLAAREQAGREGARRDATHLPPVGLAWLEADRDAPARLEVDVVVGVGDRFLVVNGRLQAVLICLRLRGGSQRRRNPGSERDQDKRDRGGAAHGASVGQGHTVEATEAPQPRPRHEGPGYE